LPGYDGQPHAAVCLAFDEMKPRTWFGGEELRGHGRWVLGVDWLQRWIFGIGPEYGLRNGDVRALDEASGPFWDRCSTARLRPLRTTANGLARRFEHYFATRPPARWLLHKSVVSPCLLRGGIRVG
jgi:hypothetical protein